MGKLVRDRIPEIIEAEGDVADFHVLDASGYEAALLDRAPDVTPPFRVLQLIPGVVLTPGTGELPDRARESQEHQDNHPNERSRQHAVCNPKEIPVQEDRHQESSQAKETAGGGNPQPIPPEESAKALTKTAPSESKARQETHALIPHEKAMARPMNARISLQAGPDP